MAASPETIEQLEDELPGELLLRLTDAAKRLGVSYSTVYRMVTVDKTLRGIRLRRSLRVPVSALAEYIEHN